MTIIMRMYIVLIAVTLHVSCTSPTKKPEAVTLQEAEPMKNKPVTGEVQEVQPGKDGYTAKILTADSLIYFATISHANLKDNASQYRTVKVGESITVTGEIWQMEDENHITVRELK